jgi:uncharacterized protein YkwD
MRRPLAPGLLAATLLVDAVLAATTLVPARSSVAAEAAEAAYPSLSELRARALELANKDRAAAGLQPLEPLPELAEAAQRHADDMVNRGYFAHESPEGSTPETRLREAGVVRWWNSAENIGQCENCGGVPLLEHVDRFEAMWMASPEHRANLLDPELTHFGYGIAASSGNDQRAVQVFAVEPAQGTNAADDPGSGGGTLHRQ